MTTEQRLPLSVCVVAGNEAHRIRRTLESVAAWAGEIIVAVDDGVTDGTPDIARACGARVVTGPWKDHATHRNLASAHTTQSWLLALDADEVVSPGLRDELVQTIAAAQADPNAACAAYSMPRCAFYCGRWIRHGDWYPDRVVRLWQRERGHWEGITHEKLIVQGRIGRLYCDLLHYTAETINHQVAKTVEKADHFVQQCKEDGRTVSFSDLTFRPVWRFWRAYLFRLGFLDGWQGLTIAWLTAFYTFLRYVRVRETEMQKDPPR